MRKRHSVTGLLLGILVLPLICLGSPVAAGNDHDVFPVVAPPPASCAGKVALTFDDGPDASLTPHLLDMLSHYDVQVTFFVMGSHIDGNQAVIQRMVAGGHDVQNHTWDHPYLSHLDDEEIIAEVQMTTDAIVAAGAPRPEYVRPPFGDYNPDVVDLIEREGYSIVTWTNALDIRDWDGPPAPEEIIARVRDHLEDGGVLLLHDIHPNTVEAVPGIINAIHEEGFCLAQLDDDPSWNLDA